jgi:NADH-quinone oxidoreductase subunit H
MPTRRQKWLLHLLALVAWVALGCVTNEAGPQLLHVVDLVPRQAEPGDRLEVVGTGFPEGKPARVTFRGTLNRPGSPHARAAIDIDAVSTSSDRIEMVFTEGLRAAFCGQGDQAVHTTFVGDVVVSFPASSKGALPITGELKAISVDFHPPAGRRAIVRAREDEGQRALDFMGLTVAEDSEPSGGLRVAAVRPSSGADLAGIVPGDVIASFDGVRVAGRTDVNPSGETRSVAVSVRHASSPTGSGSEAGAISPAFPASEEIRQISLEGYDAGASASLMGSGLILLIAAAIISLFMVPASRIITWAERRVVCRMQPRAGESGAGLRDRFARISDGVKSIVEEDVTVAQNDKPLFRFVPYLVFVGVSAAFCVMSFGQHVVGDDLDIGILFVVAASSLSMIGFLLGGAGSNDRWALLGAIRSAVQVASCELPGAIAIVCIVMVTGSLRARDIIRAQGGWPWEWFVFRTPFTFALFALWLATVLADGSRVQADLPEVESEPGSGPSRTVSGVRNELRCFAGWANVFVMCAIASALFLGGWQVPGTTPYQQEASLAWQVLGALLFQLKSCVAVAVVVWLRSALPRVRVDQTTSLCWKYIVPASLAALASTGVWMAYGPAPLVQTYVAIAMFASCVIVLACFALTVRHGLRGAPVPGRLNPFL